MPRNSKRGASWHYALETEQRDKLVSVAKELDDRIVIKLMVYLGMRNSEVGHMNANWIRGGEIRIPSSQPCDCVNCAASKHPGVWQPKSKAGIRTMPVIDILADDIYRFFKENPRGLRLTRQAIWEKIKRLASKAKIEVPGLSRGTVYPHALRATAGTYLAAKGMTATELCYIMGWATISMGEHYIRIAVAREESHNKLRMIYKG